MGVLACDRRGCDNVMCDYVSHEHGYLCYECIQELKSKPFINIKSFMETTKESSEYKGDWDYIVDSYFKSRYDEDNY